MNVLGVLINPLDWQIEHGHQAVDPAGVQFDEATRIPVRLDFEEECGFAKVERTGNGGLYATCTITSHSREILRRNAAGQVKLAAELTHLPVDEDETVEEAVLVCVAICDQLFDDAQPSAEVVE